MSDTLTLLDLEKRGIKAPPKDYVCDICNKKQKNKSLSYVNGFWVCIYLDCVNKAQAVKK